MNNELIVDLHIHSRFARATSKELNVINLYKWSKIKGINIIGTGDFTHPTWFEELKRDLQPAEEGFYTLREEILKEVESELPASVRDNRVRFVYTVEINTVYKKQNKGRRVHNIVCIPSDSDVTKFNKELSKFARLDYDGRPTISISCKELLEISLNVNEHTLFIPAHIWTPWFAMFGSKSGFNSIEESFEEMSKYVYAVETGLSSDPEMNYQVSALGNRTIMSFSDAHSLHNLGREATIYTGLLDYNSLYNAIKSNSVQIAGTIEFYPEEGKYHYDGHRQCKVSMHPSASAKVNNLCPVCGKPMTTGVLNRVTQLSDVQFKRNESKTRQSEHIIPLSELIASSLGVKSKLSVKVTDLYNKIIAEFGDEFKVLRSADVSELELKGFSQLAVAIKKMREGDVKIEPGYDGEYGKIEIDYESDKLTLF